jgi:hypothetical protein
VAYWLGVGWELLKLSALIVGGFMALALVPVGIVQAIKLAAKRRRKNKGSDA